MKMSPETFTLLRANIRKIIDHLDHPYWLHLRCVLKVVYYQLVSRMNYKEATQIQQLIVNKAHAARLLGCTDLADSLMCVACLLDAACNKEK